MSRAVLLVDADPQSNKLAGIVLKSDGWVVIAVTTMRDALDTLRTFTPDLIATELKLPDSNGLELVSAVKADPKTRSIPIVAVTSLNDQTATLAAGCAGYVRKPIDVMTFASQLARFLGATP